MKFSQFLAIFVHKTMILPQNITANTIKKHYIVAKSLTMIKGTF